MIYKYINKVKISQLRYHPIHPYGILGVVGVVAILSFGQINSTVQIPNESINTEHIYTKAGIN